VTWLPDLAPGDTDWERMSAFFPGAFDAVEQLHRAVWAAVDPVLVELARLRIAILLGFEAGLALRSHQARDAGLDAAKIVELPSWPSSPLFSARERACIALAEQFVIDVNGVTDQLVDDVLAHLSPAECFAYVNALSALENLQRACLTLGVTVTPETTWLSGA
jgi:alkylhydroperoxidase family enzyme